WLGLDWDEGPEVGGELGPYFQMQRLHFYRAAAERLLDEKKAYLCYCTPEELKERRKAALARGQTPGYDRRCRELSSKERATLESQGRKPALRFAMPLEGETVVHDLVRGDVHFANQQLDDLIIMRADGFPTYNFAVVVDDILMQMTHVIRADEHLTNTPRQIQIYEALGHNPPQFAHVSMILGLDHTKLSKRHGATSVSDYRDAGYLPEAMVNFLALLGWAYDDKRELFTREELIDYFGLEKVNPAPSIFSEEKLDWMNGLYIRQLEPDDLARRLLPFLKKAGLEADIDTVRRLVPLIQERMRVLSDSIELVDFFLKEEIAYDPQLLIGKKMTAQESHAALKVTRERLENLSLFDEESLENALRNLADELCLTAGQLFSIIRIAVTGKMVAPPLFGTLAVLGKERALWRIDLALEHLARLAQSE
ncbi:MAG: glutamate--tRNA ligase, partial [Anaerolineae bacterium]|nr:glutamate--tRNA ligase [Anaerolineae bacterium]